MITSSSQQWRMIGLESWESPYHLLVIFNHEASSLVYQLVLSYMHLKTILSSFCIIT